MKFINYLKGVDGVTIYPLIALVIFFIVFVIVAITLITSKKEFIEASKNIPFSQGQEHLK